MEGVPEREVRSRTQSHASETGPLSPWFGRIHLLRPALGRCGTGTNYDYAMDLLEA